MAYRSILRCPPKRTSSDNQSGEDWRYRHPNPDVRTKRSGLRCPRDGDVLRTCGRPPSSTQTGTIVQRGAGETSAKVTRGQLRNIRPLERWADWIVRRPVHTPFARGCAVHLNSSCFVAVLLPIYLLALGFIPFKVGVIATASLLGSGLLTMCDGFLGATRSQPTSVGWGAPDDCNGRGLRRCPRLRAAPGHPICRHDQFRVTSSLWPLKIKL